MNELLTSPWPWYVSGTLLGISIPLLLFFGNKMLGLSSSMRHICTALIPSKKAYFNYNWKDGLWNIMAALGVLLGGLFARFFMQSKEPVAISEATINDLSNLGISDFSGYIPQELMGIDQLLTLNGIIFIVVGGFFVGFGTRYAGGCTSGHGFMGLSQASISSLVAVCAFFAGGLIMTHFIFPIIL